MNKPGAGALVPGSIRAVALDLDGVVYQGKTMLPGADKAVCWLRDAGIRVYFVTNSSVRTRAEIAGKLTGMGIPAAEGDIITSAYVASVFIRGQSKSGKRVLAIGTESLKAELISAGASVVPAGPCDFVVVGMDTAFGYDKIVASMDAILGGALFVACNRDPNFPVENGKLLPGCGAIVSAIEAACGVQPHHLVGKPNVMMLELIVSDCRVRPEEILVVGDVIESDIAMADAFGSPSVLVCADPKLGSPGRGMPWPTLRIDSLGDLPKLLEK